MFSILKWFVNIILILMAVYFGIVLYNYIKDKNTANDLTSTISSASLQSFTDKIGLKATVPDFSLQSFVDFFKPKFISPLTVVPSQNMDVVWGSNGSQLTGDIDADFKRYMDSLGYPNNVSGVLATNTETVYNNKLILQNLQNQNNKKLELLFPSSWMQGR